MVTDKPTNQETIAANRERLYAWAKEGRSYYWMGRQLGLGDRSANGAVSLWFLSQGVRRKPTTKQPTIS